MSELAKAVKSKRKRDKRLRERKNTRNLDAIAKALTTLVENEEAKERENVYPLISGAKQLSELMHAKYVLTPNMAIEGLALVEQMNLLLIIAADRFNAEAGDIEE